MQNDDDAPKRLANFGFAAKWAGGITLLCLAVGQGAEQYAAALGPTQSAAIGVSPIAQPKASRVDPESVGAIRAQSATPSSGGD